MEEQIIETPEVEIDYKQEFEKLKQDFEKIVKVKDDLFLETKKNKKERDEAKASIEKAKEEKAKQDGEYESLWKLESDKAKSLEAKIKEIQDGNRIEKIKNRSLELATDIASNSKNAKLLERFISDKLQGLADDSGYIPEDVLESVRKEFKQDDIYSSLVAGSQASGGGAPGQSHSMRGQQSMDRAAFSKLNPVQQSDYVARIRKGEAQLTD